MRAKKIRKQNLVLSDDGLRKEYRETRNLFPLGFFYDTTKI
jgi:hypothetical protein